MNRIIAQIIGLIIFCSNAFSTAVISGKIINCPSQEIKLEYYGGLYSMPAKYYLPDDLYQVTNDKGEFRFEFETSKNYCCYFLSVDTTGCNIYIKDNDSLYITFDPNIIEASFQAYGNDNRLTNFMFVDNHFFNSYPNETVSDGEMISFFRSKRADFLKLLESFWSGRLQNFENIDENKQIIIKGLINITRLTQEDYEILNNYSNEYISSAIYFTSIDYQFLHIDDFLSLFKNVDFKDHFIFHDASMQSLVDDYVRFSCYKKYIETTDSVTYHDAYEYFKLNEFTVAKELLSGDVLKKYLGDRMYSLLLSGKYESFEQLYSQSMALLNNTLYKKVVDRFYNNYQEAITDKEYNLNQPKYHLSDSSLIELLNYLKGEKVYFILWKIDRTTSYSLTPLSELHDLTKIKESSKDKNIRFIDICLADESSKKHWASLIVQYKWKGEHYFISKQYVDEFRELFNCQDRMKYCSSELYLLLDENGNILSDNGSYMTIY